MLTTADQTKTYTIIEAIDLIETEKEVVVNDRDGLIMYMQRPKSYLDEAGKQKGSLKRIIILDTDGKKQINATFDLSQIKYKLWRLYTNDNNTVEKYEGTVPNTSTGKAYAPQYLDYQSAKELVMSQNKVVLGIDNDVQMVRKDVPVIYQDADSKRLNIPKPSVIFTDMSGNESPVILTALLNGQRFVESYTDLATMQVGRLKLQ